MLVYTTGNCGCYNATTDEFSPEAETSNLGPDPANWRGVLKRLAREAFHETRNLRFKNFDLEIQGDDEFDPEDLEADSFVDDETFKKEGLFVNVTQEEIYCSESWACEQLQKPADEYHQWVVMTAEEWEKVCKDEERVLINWEVWLRGPDGLEMIGEGQASGNGREDKNGESEAWRNAYKEAADTISFDLREAGVEDGDDSFPGPDGPLQDGRGNTFWEAYTPYHDRLCDGFWLMFDYMIKFFPID